MGQLRCTVSEIFRPDYGYSVVKKVSSLFPFRSAAALGCLLPSLWTSVSCGVAHSKRVLQYPAPFAVLTHGEASKASKRTSDFWPRRACSSNVWQAGWRKCHTAGVTSEGVWSGGGVCDSTAELLCVCGCARSLKTLITQRKIQQTNNWSRTPKTDFDISKKVKVNYHVRLCSMGGNKRRLFVSKIASTFE